MLNKKYTISTTFRKNPVINQCESGKILVLRKKKKTTLLILGQLFELFLKHLSSRNNMRHVESRVNQQELP